MSDTLDVKELLEAGIHYGHHTGRWNPRMKPYIYGKRNALHIIDIKETIRGILLAKKYLTRVVKDGKDVIFVGTKRQAKKSIMTHAENLGMYWVTDRWIGGTLTNFREIRKRVRRLEELEQLEADGLMDAYSKKEGSRLRREMRKIQRNLGGIRKMTGFPGALVVIDPSRERIAIQEARRLKIPVIALIDTESNPETVDIPIPGNDDAMRAIEIVVRELASAVEMGLKIRGTSAAKEEVPAPRKRSSRPTTARAVDSEDLPAAIDAPEATSPEAAAETAEPTAETETPEPAPPAAVAEEAPASEAAGEEPAEDTKLEA